jgi:hypothetical protein
MTDTEKSTQRRWHLIWAGAFLLFSIDSLFGPPKYFSAVAYIAMAVAYSIKGFSLFESRRWGRPIFNTLSVIAVVLMAISIGRRVMA